MGARIIAAKVMLKQHYCNAKHAATQVFVNQKHYCNAKLHSNTCCKWHYCNAINCLSDSKRRLLRDGQHTFEV
jgi:hypothetical protein